MFIWHSLDGPDAKRSAFRRQSWCYTGCRHVKTRAPRLTDGKSWAMFQNWWDQLKLRVQVMSHKAETQKTQNAVPRTPFTKPEKSATPFRNISFPNDYTFSKSAQRADILFSGKSTRGKPSSCPFGWAGHCQSLTFHPNAYLLSVRSLPSVPLVLQKQPGRDRETAFLFLINSTYSPQTPHNSARLLSDEVFCP